MRRLGKGRWRAAIMLFLVAAACRLYADHCCPERASAALTGTSDPLLYALPAAVYRREPLPSQDNAYPNWQEAVRDFQALSKTGDERVLDLTRAIVREERVFPDGATGQDLTAWLAQYRSVLDQVDRAAAMDRLQLPPLDLPRERFPAWRSVAHLKILRAKQRAAQGDWDGAVRDLRDVLHLSAMLAEGDAELMRFLVAISMEKSALAGVRSLAANTAAPDSVLADLRLLVRESDHHCTAWAGARRVEFTTFHVPMLARFASNGAPDRLLEVLVGTSEEADERARRRAIGDLLSASARPFDLAETVHLTSQQVEYDVDACALPWKKAERWAADHLPRVRDAERLLEALIDGAVSTPSADAVEQAHTAVAGVVNPLGRCWLRRYGRVSYVGNVFHLRAQWRATMLAVALQSYRRRHGALPPSLAALDAALGSAAIDPFSGEPFRYLVGQAVLWSVGENGRDDGGQARDGERDGAAADDDILWRVRVHQPTG